MIHSAQIQEKYMFDFFKILFKRKQDRILREIDWRDEEDAFLTVKRLINQGFNINLTDRNKTSLLHKASQFGYIGICELLISHNANLNIQDKDGRTPLYVACSFKRADVCDLLLKNGANIEQRTKFEYTPLYLASANNYGEIIRLLLSYGAKPNSAHNNIISPLHLAVYNGCMEACEILLSNGAFPNIQDSVGRTPLHWAASGSHPKIVKMLLEFNANPNISDTVGQLPIHFVQRPEIFDLLSPITHNINHQTKDFKQTPISVYVSHQRIQLVKKALRSGANLTLPDIDGYTPLHIAGKSLNIELCSLLALYNPSVINMTDKKGQTTLDLILNRLSEYQNVSDEEIIKVAQLIKMGFSHTPQSIPTKKHSIYFRAYLKSLSIQKPEENTRMARIKKREKITQINRTLKAKHIFYPTYRGLLQDRQTILSELTLSTPERRFIAMELIKLKAKYNRQTAKQALKVFKDKLLNERT